MQYTTTEFETFYARYFPSSIRLSQSLLHDEEEARDIVQEAFLRLWESDTRIDNPAAFIIKAVRNASLNRVNQIDTREKIRRRLSLKDPEDDDESDIEARLEETRSAVESILTQREHETLDLIYSDGMSYKEAAEKLGVSTATVNKHLVGALKKLRNHLKREKP